MDDWTRMIPVAVIGVVVRLMWDRLREPNPSAEPHRFVPEPTPIVPEPARAPRAKRVRPRVHEVLRTATHGEHIMIAGRIHHSAGALIAPLSGIQCAAYAAYAHSLPDDRGAPPPVDLCEMRLAPLVVEVADGTLSIEGDAIVRLRCAPVSPRNVERETAFLASQQLEDLLPTTAFAEAVLQVGDPVWVSGVLVRERGGEHGYRELPRQACLEGRPGQPLSLGRSRARWRRRSRRRSGTAAPANAR